LDFFFQFFLFARDGGRPTTLQSRLKLNLTVVDVNDNRPVFTQPAGENRTVYASTLQKEKHFFQLKVAAAISFFLDLVQNNKSFLFVNRQR